MTKPSRVFTLISLALIAQIVASAASQTIAFDAIPNQIFGVSPFVIAAQAGSALPVSFTSTMHAVCKTASAFVMLLGTGTCSITASQPGNAAYSVAAPVTRSFTVSLAKPSGTFDGTLGSPFASGPLISAQVAELHRYR